MYFKLAISVMKVLAARPENDEFKKNEKKIKEGLPISVKLNSG